ncbi:BQ5605_C010g06075 [Microbotryum silenes-dioicae]|uniref:BQ5605_C010g06075 protein n=1 Tax=Microbotryum silenes-dioicae TaxID=796604 RepID=A0A2X0NTC6_9BASI|nr:BQ5605_C010g06075 [Microbotryum silenes-dioicae]
MATEYIPPLTSLSAAEQRSIKSSLLTEHFQFPPETFARNGMDLANQTIYAATKIVEDSLMTMTRLPEEEGDERPFVFEGDDVQKGVYRLETLLEAAVDKYFDLFELFALRNSFNLPSELIPYIVLFHQERLDDALLGQDRSAIEEYEHELASYEQTLQKERALKCVEELGQRKLDRINAIANEVGQMSSAEPMSTRIEQLSSQLPQLHQTLSVLLETPSPSLGSALPSSTTTTNAHEPWSESRSAFVNWATKAKIDALPSSSTLTGAGSSGSTGDSALEGLRRGMQETGGGGEALVS